MRSFLNVKNILIIIIVLLLVLVNIVLYIKYDELNKSDKQENVVVTEKNVISENNTNSDNDVITKLKSMSERERMEYYFSEFMDYIENGKYQEAYDLLYPEFKENYFKTLEDFKEYVDKTYPEFVSFSYNDIERQGSIYVLMITVINPELKKEDSKMSQRIVIKENNFNDFVLSFQVI